MDKKVFITGATGLIGSAVLYDALRTKPEIKWVALIRGSSEKEAYNKLLYRVSKFCNEEEARELLSPVNIIVGDISDAPRFNYLLEDVTHILHLAADTTYTSKTVNWNINYDGTIAVAELASKLPNLKRFVHTGTATICGTDPDIVVYENEYPRNEVNHLVEYTKSKAAAEFILQERYSHLPIVVARPTIVAGHTILGAKPSFSLIWFLRFMEQVGIIPGEDYNFRADIIPIDWTAYALLELLFKDKLNYKTYHLSAGETSFTSPVEVIHKIAEVKGIDLSKHEKLELYPSCSKEFFRERISSRLNCDKRILLIITKAAQRFYTFLGMNVVFSNERLLEENIAPSPKLVDYIDVCIKSSDKSVIEQFIDDLEMFQGIETSNK